MPQLQQHRPQATRPPPQATTARTPSITQPGGNAAAQDALTQGAQQQQGDGRQLKHAPVKLNTSAYEDSGLRPEVLEQALTAYDNAYKQGEVERLTLTVVDYSLPSDEKRMWVIDLKTGALLHHVLVAHGSGSGGRNSTDFSNTDSSHQSSLGVMKTGETYYGKHGYSMRMDGLEDGFNDEVRDRAIVMHSADYVNDDRAKRKSVGRSWGCLAMDPKVSRKVIDTVKDGTLVVSWYPDPEWQKKSEYLKQP